MRVVIVGAGQAGAALAAKLRSLGHQGEIVMLGDEPAPPYQRPPLSKAYLLGEIKVHGANLRDPQQVRAGDSRRKACRRDHVRARRERLRDA